MKRYLLLAGLAALLAAPAGTLGKESPDPVNRIVLIGDTADWVDTGLRVRPQDRLTIRVGSEVCFSGGSEESCVRSVGWPRETYAERWPGDAAACEDPFPQWNHAIVVARVGGEALAVGKQTVLTGREGRVELGLNDCSFEGEFANRGELSVSLVVENPTAHAARSGRELIDEALEALGGKAARRLESLAVRAACTGPGGEFTTEVFSKRPDRTVFRQRSGEDTTEWLAIGERAWRIDRERGVRKAADKMLPMIEGHEFQLMLFELDERFVNHTVPVPDRKDPEAAAAAAEGSGAAAGGADHPACLRVEMEDRHGAPAAVCLDPESYLPERLSFQPGGRKKEPTIEMELESWREIDGVQYLEAFTLRQGEDVFTYRFESIEPNAVDRSVFEEVSAYSLEQIRKRRKRGSEKPAESDPGPNSEPATRR